MSDELKKAEEFAREKWYILLPILLICLTLWLWNRGNAAISEAERLRASQNISQQIENNDSKLDEMKEREKEYPKKEQEVSDLEKKKQELKKDQKEDVKKEEIINELEKADINGIAAEFSRLGYPCTVVRQ